MAWLLRGSRGSLTLACTARDTRQRHLLTTGWTTPDPSPVSTHRSRTAILEGLIEHIARHPGEWWGTHAEIANYVVTRS